MSYEDFLKFLANGIYRAPALYSKKYVEGPKEANVVRLDAAVEKPKDLRTIGERMAQERLDWQKKAANDEDWAAVEE